MPLDKDAASDVSAAAANRKSGAKSWPNQKDVASLPGLFAVLKLVPRWVWRRPWLRAALIAGVAATALFEAFGPAFWRQAYLDVKHAIVILWDDRLPPIGNSVQTRGLAVAVAHFEGDTDFSVERSIFESLRNLHGIDARNCRRMLRVANSRSPADDERAADELARTWLDQSHTDLLVWGYVIAGHDPHVRIMLTRRHGERADGLQLEVSAVMKFPVVAADEFESAVAAEVLQSLARYDQGRAVAAELTGPMQRLNALVSDARSTEGRVSLLMALGNAEVTYADQTGDQRVLVNAVRHYRTALTEAMKSPDKIDSTRILNNLGEALTIIDKRASGVKHFEQALEAYTEAAKQLSPEESLERWTDCQNGLGNLLRIWGERELGTERLEKAVSVLTNAVREEGEQVDPIRRARTLDYLGLALRSLGSRQKPDVGIGTFKHAIEVLQQSLEIRSKLRKTAPLEWAATQAHLGDCCWYLGEHSRGTERRTYLEAAVTAYTNSLVERRKEIVRLDWASSTTNLGNALMSLGNPDLNPDPSSCIDYLARAESNYRSSLGVYRDSWDHFNEAMTTADLAIALSYRSRFDRGTDRLEEAIQLFKSAAEGAGFAEAPIMAQRAREYLGEATVQLGHVQELIPVLVRK